MSLALLNCTTFYTYFEVKRKKERQLQDEQESLMPMQDSLRPMQDSLIGFQTPRVSRATSYQLLLLQKYAIGDPHGFS